ncbi:MAG: hypothetical protein LBM02_02605 [Lachnospiraceae bacterium]|jgi:hypothetical protein|nr:hypothetical protein [Lachnospiraceae bacterium]
MKKLLKGKKGYIKYIKKRNLKMSILEAFILLIIYMVGIEKYGTPKNVFTIIAIVGVLPFARAFVQFILVVKFKGISGNIYKEIEKHIKDYTAIYELPFSTSSKVYCIQAAVIKSNNAYFYIEDKNVDEGRIYEYLLEFMISSGFSNARVRISTKPEDFLSQIRQIDSFAVRNEKLEKDISKALLTQLV